jgi:hypothetical protein
VWRAIRRCARLERLLYHLTNPEDTATLPVYDVSLPCAEWQGAARREQGFDGGSRSKDLTVGRRHHSAFAGRGNDWCASIVVGGVRQPGRYPSFFSTNGSFVIGTGK